MLDEREELLKLLEQQYGSVQRGGRRTYLRKKYAWLIVVRSTYVLKRLIDILISFTALLLLSPLFLLVALAIKLSDGGPILYVSDRVGKLGQRFRFPKFRSMVTDAEHVKRSMEQLNDHGNSITFKMKEDPRITRLGRLIRRTSIDELPQLWCVLTGRMSLVGPRPPLPTEVARYTRKERRRLDIKPGLTCFWQVEGRGDLAFEQQLELDVQYIESNDLWLDLRILLRTIPAVLLGKGAY